MCPQEKEGSALDVSQKHIQVCGIRARPSCKHHGKGKEQRRKSSAPPALLFSPLMKQRSARVTYLSPRAAAISDICCFAVAEDGELEALSPNLLL